MNVSEIRAKSQEDLRAELFNLSREQFKLRMQKGAGQQTRPSEFKQIRRDIARIKTVLWELEGRVK